MAKTRVGFWTSIWPTTHCRLKKEVTFSFNAGKTELVPFDQYKNAGTIDVKTDRSFLEEKSPFNMLLPFFSPKLVWSCYIVSIGSYTFSKKIQGLICSITFLSLLRLDFISINQPYHLAWHAAVMSGLVCLAATWICLIIQSNGYLELLVLHLLHVLNLSWLIAEM